MRKIRNKVIDILCTSKVIGKVCFGAILLLFLSIGMGSGDTSTVLNVSQACKESNITVYNISNDFSLKNNPNGCWSYGYENSFGSSLQLYDNATTNARGIYGLDSWTASSIGVDPHVVHNRLNTSTMFTTSVIIPANGTQFHPGPHGEFSVIRWTARASGKYSLDVNFSGNDFIGPTTTDVHVLQNNIPIFNGTVTYFGCCTPFETNISLSRGDTIDFMVGVGPDGSYSFDSTGIDGSIARRT